MLLFLYSMYVMDNLLKFVLLNVKMRIISLLPRLHQSLLKERVIDLAVLLLIHLPVLLLDRSLLQLQLQLLPLLMTANLSQIFKSVLGMVLGNVNSLFNIFNTNTTSID